MTQGHALWQRVFRELAPQYPGIEARHLYIDALALLMVQNPAQFDVIVTNNLFGDIVTDLGAALQGGLGLAASGNLHPGQDVDVRAGARIGAAAGREERREPDGRDPVGRADARLPRAEAGSGRDRSRGREAVAAGRARGRSAARSARARPATTSLHAYESTTVTTKARKHEARTRDLVSSCCFVSSCLRGPGRDTHMTKPEVFIVGGARTPMTDYVGALKDVSALELGAIARARRLRDAPASSPSGSSTRSSATCCRPAPTRSTARATSRSRPACRSTCRR